MTHALTPVRSNRVAYALAVLALPVTVLLWAYWTTLAEVTQAWASDAQYSHGYLVPGFALLLLYLRRDRLQPAALRANWGGLLLLLASVGLRFYGAYFGYVWYDQISLLPCIAGICVLAGGWHALRWSWPSIAFLFFMIPLPHRMSVQMAGPLQRIATEATTFLLQTLGRPAVSEGNVILLNEVELGVVEACSGLRMLVIFFALSTAVALLMKKPLWEKLLVCGSAVPIALVTNILRITATGLLHEGFGKEVADAVFHDLAGWLMMPLGLLFLALELKLLRHLLIEPAADVTVAAAVAAPQPVFTSAASEPTPRTSRRQRQPRPAAAKPFGLG